MTAQRGKIGSLSKGIAGLLVGFIIFLIPASASTKHKTKDFRDGACADASHVDLRALPKEPDPLADDIDQERAIVAAALNDPAIVSQWPDAHFSICSYAIDTGADYYSVDTGKYAGSKSGKSMKLAVKRGSETLANDKWESSFPSRADSASGDEPAWADVRNLLAALFSKLSLSQASLESLAASPVFEIQIAAIRNLHDQDVLANIADKAADAEDEAIRTHTIANRFGFVISEALKRIDDQSILADFATGKRGKGRGEFFVISRLTDPAVLEKIAQEDKDGTFRKWASDRLSYIRKCDSYTPCKIP